MKSVSYDNPTPYYDVKSNWEDYEGMDMVEASLASSLLKSPDYALDHPFPFEQDRPSADEGTIRQGGNNESVEEAATTITEREMISGSLSAKGACQSSVDFSSRPQAKESCRFGDIIGKSLCMQDMYRLIAKAAASGANVIIYGESGTGKELVANEIHRRSRRKDNRMVPVNCGAISEQLLESEFFGYKKGAFTGANADKQGFLDFADGGTLFLDELGEINLNFQAKLLRAIDSRGYTPVGSTIVKMSDFRIIAATNRDLQKHVAGGLMREDFFYRIHVIPIYLPPLRKRKEDIPLLIDHFLSTYNYTEKIPAITGTTLERMVNYPWPGNVRELENTLHRLIVTGKLNLLGEMVPQESGKKDLALEAMKKDTLGLQEASAHFEKLYIYNALEENKWHRKNVASILKISRRTLYDKMKNYNIIESGDGAVSQQARSPE